MHRCHPAVVRYIGVMDEPRRVGHAVFFFGLSLSLVIPAGGEIAMCKSVDLKADGEHTHTHTRDVGVCVPTH